MTEHELKTWPKYFDVVRMGRKRFELRKNDRDFKVGDTLYLREWNPATDDYTGRSLRVKVRYLLKDAKFLGLDEGFVIMSIDLIAGSSPAGS